MMMIRYYKLYNSNGYIHYKYNYTNTKITYYVTEFTRDIQVKKVWWYFCN